MNRKIINYQSLINKLSSVQPDFSTKHTARVKPSQYIAQHLYKQTSKSNCSSCSSQMSYLTQPRSLKIFNSSHIGNAGQQMKAIQPTKIFHLTVGLAMSNQREKDKYWKGTEQRSLFSLHTFDIRWCWKRDSHSTYRHKPMFQIY